MPALWPGNEIVTYKLYRYVGDYLARNECNDSGYTWYTRVTSLEYLYRAGAPGAIVTTMTFLIYQILRGEPDDQQRT